MDNVKRFAQQYGPLAAQVGNRIGVAPDVLLGQWGLETGWGSSVIPGTNNLGNIKDFSGRGVKATDNMTGSRDAYRAYETPEQFGDDFIKLMAGRYKTAMGAGADASKFAEALKRRGYAEDPAYVSKVTGATNLVRKFADMALSAVSGTANAAEPTGGLSDKVKKAREAGYSDDEIFQHLSQSKSFAQKLEQARAAGYSDADIRQHFGLVGSQQKAAPAAEPTAKPQSKEEAGALTNLGRGLWQGIKTDLIGGPAQLLTEGYSSLVNTVAPGTEYAKNVQRKADNLSRMIREDEAQYQRDTDGSIAAGVGRVGGNIAGALAAGGGGLVRGAASGGQRIAQALGAGQRAQAIGRGAGTATGSAALGGAAGALAPVTQEGDFGDNKLAQISTGAAIGGALPAAGAAVGGAGRYIGRSARSLVEPFTEAGQTRIAGNILQRFADGGPVSANAAELVPGSVPTLAQATGNPGLASLERGIASANPGATNAFAERSLANNAARVGLLDSIAGGPAAREAAIAAREAAVSPLYAEATAKVAPFDRELKSLLDRPSMQKAIRRAEQLAQERGGAFSLSREPAQGRTVTSTITVPGQGVAPEAAITRNVSRTTTVPGAAASIAGEGAPRAAVPERTITTNRTVSSRGAIAGEGARRPAAAFVPEREATVSRFVSPRGAIAGEGVRRPVSEVGGQDLQTLKMAMDALLEDPASGIAGKEIAAVRQTRDELVNWMEKHIPEFTQARQTYAEMSKPLAQMDIAQRLIDRYASATRDLSGNPRLRAEAFNRALQDEGKLLKNSGAFAGYRSLEDVFTPEQLRSIRAIAEDLSRETAGSNAGRAAGSNTFQNLATNNILENALPGPVRALTGGTSGPVGSVVGRVGNLVYGGANEAIQNRLLEMLMQPQSGLAALQNVGGNQLTGPLGGNALLQRLAPNLLPAGTVGINVLARPSVE